MPFAVGSGHERALTLLLILLPDGTVGGAIADVIGAFLSGTSCESLVHKLGRKGPQTTKEVLDIATSHASGEEAVGAIFDRLKGKAR